MYLIISMGKQKEVISGVEKQSRNYKHKGEWRITNTAKSKGKEKGEKMSRKYANWRNTIV